MDYSKIFYWLIDTSIKGSFLIISIILIKSFLKNRLGARWHYYIWFLLLIKLVIPFAPQSSISIFNLFTFGDHKNIISKNYIKYNPNEIISWFNEQIVDTSLLHNDSSLVLNTTFSKYISLFLQNSNQFRFVIAWAMIVTLLLLFTIIANVRFGLHVKRNSLGVSKQTNELLEECKWKTGVKTKLPIVQTGAVKTPALYGLFQPRLLLPINIEKQIDENELRFIFFHELSHLKRKDIATFWVMSFVKILYWFNPIIWYGLHQMRQDCEISCDALALSYVDHDDCKKYGQTIIHLLQNTIEPLKCIGVAGMLGSKKQLKRRIKMIALFKKNAYKLSLMSIAILILMGCTFLTNAKEKTPQLDNYIKDNTQVKEEADRLSVSTKVNDQTKTDNNQAILLKEEATKEMVWPLPDSTKITSSFGWKTHPKFNKKKLHTGTDIAANSGTSIVAAAKGTVILSEEHGGYGNTIIIDHGDGIVTLYGHCSELVAEKDQKVKAGDEIAKVGNTGMSTGPHLHFEIRKDGEPVDPFEGYIDSKYNSN